MFGVHSADNGIFSSYIIFQEHMLIQTNWLGLRKESLPCYIAAINWADLSEDNFKKHGIMWIYRG